MIFGNFAIKNQLGFWSLLSQNTKWHKDEI